MTTIRLTVFFEDPFWVGVVERHEGETLQATRQIFGAEPAPTELLDFVLRRLDRLLERPAPAVAAGQPAERRANPKRAAREAARDLARRGGTSQAHEALRLQIEQSKQVHRQQSRAEREAIETRKWELKLEKAKARHRGK